MTCTPKHSFNSSAPGRCAREMWQFKSIIFKVSSHSSTCSEIARRWMPRNHTNVESTLVQVMAWCRQTTSHYLSQCWPRSLLPYDIIQLQWFNSLRPQQKGWYFTDNIFKWKFVNENHCIFIEISQKFVPNGPIEDMTALVQGMAWHLNQCWPINLTSNGIIGTLCDKHGDVMSVYQITTKPILATLYTF